VQLRTLYIKSALVAHLQISQHLLNNLKVQIVVRYHKFWQIRLLWDNLNVSKLSDIWSSGQFSPAVDYAKSCQNCL